MSLRTPHRPIIQERRLSTVERAKALCVLSSRAGPGRRVGMVASGGRLGSGKELIFGAALGPQCRGRYPDTVESAPGSDRLISTRPPDQEPAANIPSVSFAISNVDSYWLLPPSESKEKGPPRHDLPTGHHEHFGRHWHNQLSDRGGGARVSLRRKLPTPSAGWTGTAVRLLFGAIFAIDAVLKWLPGYRKTYISQLKAAAAAGQPSWLHGWFHFWIRLQSSAPTFFAMLTGVTETALALVLLFGIARRAGYSLGIIYSLLVWAVGEGFGGPYISGSTDVGTGIVYALLFLTLLTFAPPARRETNECRSPLHLTLAVVARSWRAPCS